MKVYLSEITDQETRLSFSEKEEWVKQAVSKTDEAAGLPFRKINTSLQLRKVDNVVVVAGEIHTEINLLCSRCACVFTQPCHIQFSSLYSRDPILAGVAYMQQEGEESAKPKGQTHGKARHAHDFSQDSSIPEAEEENETSLELKRQESATSSWSETNGDLDITYLSEDYIELGELITEQLQFQIPFQPLCKKDCKGICIQCGEDKNLGNCHCKPIPKNSPFAVLQNLKESLKG